MLISNVKDLGKLLQKKRQAANLSGAELADKAHTGQAMVSRIESGKANITVFTLLKIAKALGKKLHISIK